VYIHGVVAEIYPELKTRICVKLLGSVSLPPPPPFLSLREEKKTGTVKPVIP